MNKKRIALALSFVFIFCSITNISSKSEPISEDVTYYAVIIAVERFEGNLSYNDTVCIDEDAQDMYDMLVSKENWDEENIKLLINENASKNSIKLSITDWLKNKTDENDVVLFFYSGHGWKMPISKINCGNAYIFSYNSSEPRFGEDEDISDKELDSWLDSVKCGKMTVILDSCYSGRMLKLRQKNRVILAAGGKYLLCPVDGDINLGNGIFTYFLLQGFKGVADLNNDGIVTAEEAFRYARVPTFVYSFFKQFPFITGIGPQIPYMYDRCLGDIPLVYYKN